MKKILTTYKEVIYFRMYTTCLTVTATGVSHIAQYTKILKLEKLTILKDEKFVFEAMLKGDICRDCDLYIMPEIPDQAVCTSAEHDEMGLYYKEKFNINLYVEECAVYSKLGLDDKK